MSVITRIVEFIAGSFSLFYFMGSLAEKDKKIKEIFSAASFAFLALIMLTEFFYN